MFQNSSCTYYARMPCLLHVDFALKDYLQTLEDEDSQLPVKLHYRIHFVS